MNVSILSNVYSDCEDNDSLDDNYLTKNNSNSNSSISNNNIAINTTNFLSTITKTCNDNNKSKGEYSNCLQKDYYPNDDDDDDENDTSSTLSIHSSIEDDNEDTSSDDSDSDDNHNDTRNEEDGIPKSIIQEIYTLLVLAIPSMISQLSWCIPNSIVAAYIGIQYGSMYLTSYSIVTSIISLCTLSFLEGIFNCMDTLMCQSYGYNKKYSALQLLCIRGIIVCFSITIPFILLLVLTIKFIIINLLHQEEIIADIAYEYFLIYCICLPFYILYNTIVTYLGAQNILLPEAYTVVVSVCIVLPLSLQYCTTIFNFYGTALALIITQIFQTLFLLCYVVYYYSICYTPNTWNNNICYYCSIGKAISKSTTTNKDDNSNTTAINEDDLLQTTTKSKSTHKNKTLLNTSTNGNCNYSILTKAIFNTKSMSAFIWLSLGGVLATSEWIYWEIICLLISNISGSSSSSSPLSLSELSAATTTMNTTTTTSSLLSYDNTYDTIVDTNFTLSSLSSSTSIALSIHTIPTQIVTVTYMIYIGFGIAISLRIGNVLPINPCNAKRICYICCIFCIFLFSIISIVTYIYQDSLIQLFTNDRIIINGCKEIWSNVCIYSFTIGIYALNSSIATGLGQQWTFGIYTIVILFGIGIPLFYYNTVTAAAVTTSTGSTITSSGTNYDTTNHHQNDINIIVTAWNCIVPPNILLNIVMGIKLLSSSQSDWEQIAENVRIREDNEEKELQELIN